MYTKFTTVVLRQTKGLLLLTLVQGALNKLSCIKQNTNLKTGKNTSTYSISGISGKKRERERDFGIINVKYKEISWRVRRRRKKVTSRSTE